MRREIPFTVGQLIRLNPTQYNGPSQSGMRFIVTELPRSLSRYVRCVEARYTHDQAWSAAYSGGGFVFLVDEVVHA